MQDGFVGFRVGDFGGAAVVDFEGALVGDFVVAMVGEFDLAVAGMDVGSVDGARPRKLIEMLALAGTSVRLIAVTVTVKSMLLPSTIGNE